MRPNAFLFQKQQLLLEQMAWPMLVILLICVAPSLAGCSHGVSVVDVPTTAAESQVSRDAIAVSGRYGWVDTGVDVAAGEVVTIVGSGRVVVNGAEQFSRKEPTEVGPEGTYLFSNDVIKKEFPLPSTVNGPTPCYALIGRIGDGEVFFVGRRKSLVAEQGGRLNLGINDFDVSDNSGEFYAEITKPEVLQPVGYEETITRDAKVFGAPLEGCSVVVFYLDGLRPDVVREMAAMGHIPNIRDLFVEGGAWMSNTFTAFPSDTITSNGTMWTGCFSDRHGLKGQVRFSRRTLVSESYLDPLGPNRSARLLKPQGIDQFLQKTQAASIRIVRGEKQSQEWQASQTSGIPPLYAHLRSQGSDWSTGILPMMTEVPPPLWTRSMMLQMPYLRSQQAWKYVDDANTYYAVHHLLQRPNPVTIIWLPETDTVSHKESRGQFGMTRRTIAEADILIGQVVAELAAQDRLDKTYLFLISDHGHHGGRRTHLSHFDIADELFYRPREVTSDGRWIGGGFGLSVRQHRSWNRHQGDSGKEFMYIDGNSDGVARIFLPKGHYRSQNWNGPNRPGDLLAYEVDKNQPAINLVDSIAATRTLDGNGEVQFPVDLVLMKLTQNSLLISTSDRGQAVIDRKRNDEDQWIYRYTPVNDVQPGKNGTVVFREIENPRVDPLGLLKQYYPEILKYYHDEQEWLEASISTRYPDSVVTLTRHMLWQDNLKTREAEFAPDLVITARSGWYFGGSSSPGTMHGYPFHDSMRASWFVSGPNVRQGARIEAGSRLVDLTPTILDMVGMDVDEKEFDGKVIRAIYESNKNDSNIVSRPVYWQDVDLQAWKAIRYSPLQKSEYAPFTINRPASPFDINNVVYNVLTIGELSVFRLFDDIVSPLSGGKRYATNGVERMNRRIRRKGSGWTADGVGTLNMPGVTLSDYSATSLGNLKRVDGVVDWVQKRGQSLDHKVAKPLGRQNTLGNRVINKTIDTTQTGFWELYRFVQRVVIEVIDETVLNGLENGTDRAINHFRELPAEVIVDEEK